MRKLGAVLFAVVLAATLGACGERGGGGNGAAPNRHSGGDGVATNLAALARAIGESTARTSSAHLVITADAGGTRLTAEGDVNLGPDGASMSMTMAIPRFGEAAFVVVDGVVYLELPREVEPGRQWVRIDPTSDNPAIRALGTLGEQFRRNADPRRTLERLRDAGTVTAQAEGVELYGEPTTHYEITVDAATLAERGGSPVEPREPPARPKDFPVELWINEDGLPVRMTTALVVTDPTTGRVTPASVRADYTKWGAPVEITAPPAGQVTELPPR